MKYQIFFIALIHFSILSSMERPPHARQRPIAICGTYDPMLLENSKIDPSWTDLHEAAYRGNMPLLFQEIAKAVKIKGTTDIRDKFGQTPLWWAAKNGKKEAVNVLLKAGANTQCKDMFGRSPSLFICANPSLKILLSSQEITTLALPITTD